MPALMNGPVALPAIFDADSLEQVRDALAAALESPRVEISARSVERVATNALFLLLSAAESARLNDRRLRIVEPSETFSAAVERLGLGRQFHALFQS